MFFRRRAKPDLAATRFANGWTDEMLDAMIGDPSHTRSERSRRTAHVDKAIHLVGAGVSINKFEVQRTLWGWVVPAHGPGITAPAFVRVELFDSEKQAGYPDEDERITPEADATADYLERVLPARTHARPRYQVGHAVLHAQGDGSLPPTEDPAELQRGMTPFLDVRLQLTRMEWAPLRECVEMSLWRDGRGPSFTVRIELPEELDREELRREPWGQTFPVTSVVKLGEGLDAHPLFKSAIAAGGIGDLF